MKERVKKKFFNLFFVEFCGPLAMENRFLIQVTRMVGMNLIRCAPKMAKSSFLVDFEGLFAFTTL